MRSNKAVGIDDDRGDLGLGHLHAGHGLNEGLGLGGGIEGRRAGRADAVGRALGELRSCFH